MTDDESMKGGFLNGHFFCYFFFIMAVEYVFQFGNEADISQSPNHLYMII